MLIFCKFTEFRNFNLLGMSAVNLLITAVISGAVDVSVFCCFIEGLGGVAKSSGAR